MSDKRIGIFDYELENFHANVYLDAIRGPLADRGFQIVGATALNEQPSRAWCERKEVPYFESLNALGEACDYLMILAPSNPEKHWEMCQAAFPLGKPTFVDKTFAPDLPTAEKIFECADRYGVAIQSTSALRSTNIQQVIGKLRCKLQSMTIYSSGTSFEEYGIHPFELAISCMGSEVSAICRMGSVDVQQYILQFSEDRTAVINFSQISEIPFSTTLVTSEDIQHLNVETDQLFVDAAASILDFFDAEEPLVDCNETLVIRHLLDLAENAEVWGRFVEIGADPQPPEPVSAPHWAGRRASQRTELGQS